MSDELAILQAKSKDELIEELISKNKLLREFQEQLISKQLFIEISKELSPAVCEISCDLNIRNINSAAEKMFKVTLEECVAKPVTRFIHPIERERLRQDAMNIFKGDFWNPKVYNAMKSDGTEFCIIVASSPILEDNKPMGIRSYIFDVYEYKEAHRLKMQNTMIESEKESAVINEMQYKTVGGIVTRDPQMKEIFDFIEKIADLPSTVLITGEHGCGKELIARNIHQSSSRKTMPLVIVNCGAMPENLLESELFGYKAGAFTDAKKDKKGKFVIAEGGTIFLDEIGDLPLSMQVKILRVLQEKTVAPLGSNEDIQINVRVIAATNRNLEEMIKNGTFREDLYFRLKVLQVKVPPLRERRTDIPVLCDHFIKRFNISLKKTISTISNDVMQLLLSYDYPGNIRELIHIIEYACIFCQGKEIDISHLPKDLYLVMRKQQEKVIRLTDIDPDEKELASGDDDEKQLLLKTIMKAGGNKTLAAKKLGMHKSTLFRKLKKHDLILEDVFEKMF